MASARALGSSLSPPWLRPRRTSPSPAKERRRTTKLAGQLISTLRPYGLRLSARFGLIRPRLSAFQLFVALTSAWRSLRRRAEKSPIGDVLTRREAPC